MSGDSLGCPLEILKICSSNGWGADTEQVQIQDLKKVNKGYNSPLGENFSFEDSYKSELNCLLVLTAL